MIAKDPTKVRAGQAGALVRWGVPRVVRLGDLPEAQRRLCLALIDAVKATPAEGNAGMAMRTEGHGNGTPIAS